MTNLLPSLISAALLLVPVFAAHADSSDNSITIASGALGSTYRDTYGPNLGRLLHGYKVIQAATSGSGENLELLADDKADLIFTQADVYAARLAQDPNRYGQFVVIGRVADECIYVARRTTSDISNLTQLGGDKSKAAAVAVGPPGSGASGTWDYLATLVPGLEKVEKRPEGGTLALNQLAVGAYDAVVWVTDPNNHGHPNFRTVELNDALTLMALSDPSLISALPDGTQVYRARLLKPDDDSRNAPPLNTVCTSALVLARKDAAPKLIKKAADAVALNTKKIAPNHPKR
jgi:TRAP-type uncharacterized transport system substrate-binding protein